MIGKFIKYELKGNYKFFVSIFVSMILLSLLLFTRINKWSPPAIVFSTVCINIAAFVVVLVYLIKSFSNELYEDRGYLTLTLPIKGNRIVAGKLVVALIYFVVFSIIAGICVFETFNLLAEGQMIEFVNQYMNAKILLYVGTAEIIGMVSLLIRIYFSITISKMTLKGKKMGKLLGFLVFIGLTILLGMIQSKLGEIFPQTVYFSYPLLDKYMTQGIPTGHYINIAETVFEIFVFVLLFFVTSSFIEKRIDLS